MSVRPESLCEYYVRGHCRSCSWIPLPYAEQLRKKEEQLKDSLSPFAPFPLLNSVPSEELGFRNRAKMSVTGSVDEPVIGLLGTGTLDAGRELLDCPIHDPKLNDLLLFLPEFITRFQLIPYSIQDRKGELKGLIAFSSHGSKEMYLRFILRSRECISRLRKGLPELQARFPNLVCVSANLQPVPHAILEGPEEIFITERISIEHRIGNISFELAPQAFVQTNGFVARKLYETARDWIAEIRPDRVLELYSGQGPFSFFAAEVVKEVLGIEINADAVRVANLTAISTGQSHLKFLCLDATRVGEWVEKFREGLIIVNPPRRGLGDGVNSFISTPPIHLLYSSCSVKSLVMDLQKLQGLFRIRQAQIFDLFPHTEHFETLVLLERI